MIETCVTDPIYKSVLNVYANVTQLDFYAQLKRRFPDLKDVDFDPGTDADARFKSVYNEQGTWYFIWVRRYTGDIKSISTLNHEMFHYVAQLFRDRGLGLSRKSEEAWAYFYSYVVEKATEGLNRSRKRKGAKVCS